MNKMSLPVPFEPLDASEETPILSEKGIPVFSIETSKKRDLSSDESELESSDTEDNRKGLESSAVKPIKKVVKKLKTGFVGEKAIDLSEKIESKSKQKLKSTEVLPEIFEIPQICDQKTSISVNIVSDCQTLGEKCDTIPQEVTTGFGLISAETQKQSEMASDIDWDTSDIISDEELTSKRVPMSKWPQYSVFRNYSSGKVSVRLYIKNIDKSVEPKDLFRIYGKFIDWESEEHKNMSVLNILEQILINFNSNYRFDIRLMKIGRMKGQAFVTLPDESIARKALKETNGFLFNEKPIVVVSPHIRNKILNIS